MRTAVPPAPVRQETDLRRLFASRALTFSFAARFLPTQRRLAVTALYAFCRTVDDLADEYPAEIGGPRLEQWARWVDGITGGELIPAPPAAPDRPAGETQLLADAVVEVVERFRVPPSCLRLLIEGVRSDASRTEMQTFPELREYCYRVAGTVGQAMCYVLGAATPEACGRAERLGIAMQLTNCLRDVGEDLGRGRVYLPADDLRRFAGSGDALANKRVTAPFVALMQHEVARARAYYEAGMPGIFLLPPECRLPILIAGRLYRAILGQIEAQGYDVFTRRAATSGRHKVWTAGQAYVTLRTGRWFPPAEARGATAMSEVAAL